MRGPKTARNTMTPMATTPTAREADDGRRQRQRPGPSPMPGEGMRTSASGSQVESGGMAVLGKPRLLEAGIEVEALTGYHRSEKTRFFLRQDDTPQADTPSAYRSIPT